MRSVGAQRTVRSDTVQSAESAGRGIRPTARGRGNGLHRGRSRRPETPGAIRAAAGRRFAHTRPRVQRRLRAGVQGGRTAAVGLQVVSGHQRKDHGRRTASEKTIAATGRRRVRRGRGRQG